MHWRDGTVYRGSFKDDEQDGFGIKRDGGGAIELQFWQAGNLGFSEKMERNDRCTLEHLGRFWMFDIFLGFRVFFFCVGGTMFYQIGCPGGDNCVRLFRKGGIGISIVLKR